ncbi:tautomerase family protein [Pseudomonas abieticivorans]|uniref:tautomerase family protein n=1 Tax=Pseudomonas abieticivorans TaxID=2931382 RepID=UPI0020C0E318|nr:tautomerase family protein [Pseudomonas sp. PIA16]
MPLARISLNRGKTPEYLQRLAQGVHEALVAAFEVPATDRFQVIHQHDAGELIVDAQYLGGPRSANFVLIAITAGRTRSVEVTQGFYQALVAGLHEVLGIDPEDVMVIITTTAAHEWSFAGGRVNPAVKALAS